MTKTLKSIIGAGAIAAGLASCAPQTGLITESNFERENVYLHTPEIEGNQPRDVKSKTFEFDLEEIVINGQRLYVLPNTLPESDELDFMLVPFSMASIAFNGKRANVEPNVAYIPTKVLNGSSLPATTISLAVDGPHGVKAEREKFNVNGVATGIIRTDEKSMNYEIETIFIGHPANTEFYVPGVENGRVCNKIPATFLPFYMMDVSSAERIISPEGQITLRDKLEGIYLPQLVTPKELQERRDALNLPIERIVNGNLGRVIDIE